MSNRTASELIPYFEYDAINKLVRSHRDNLGDTLKAVIAFGPLVTQGSTFDIDLLEVIQDWRGLSRYQASSTAELPLRGKLFLNFLSDAEFASFGDATATTQDLRELQRQLLQGYEVVFEYPSGYARNILSAAIEEVKAVAGGILLTNPLHLPMDVKG